MLGLLVINLAGCRADSGISPGLTNRHGKILVVAAENEYGSMAKAIGGKRVVVDSLLDNPNTDPHEFEASAATAEVVGKANFVIKNGIGYDSWLDKLLSASPRPHRIVFSVGERLGHKTGDNPHVWYAPGRWSMEATVIARELATIEPAHARYFHRRATQWLRSLQPIHREIARLRTRLRGQRVIATEPVYGYMLKALGVGSLDAAFQKATMDGTDPSPQSVAAFENALQHHQAQMLIYNSQVLEPTSTNMRSVARQYHVPVAGITESQPPHLSFVRWQMTQLDRIGKRWRR